MHIVSVQQGREDMQKRKTRMSCRSRHMASALVVLGLAQIALSQTATAQVYYEAIPLPQIAGTVGSIPRQLNASGEVTGDLLKLPANHAFLYTRLPGFPEHVMRDLGTLGGSESHGSGINNRGHVVGTSRTSTEAFHAFVYKNGAMTDLHGLLGGLFSEADGINDTDQITGIWMDATGERRAFLYANSVMIDDIGNLGGTNSQGLHFTEAAAINNSGQVTGDSLTTTGAEHAFLYNSAIGMIDLGTLSGSYSRAYDISDTGFVTGSSTIKGDGDFDSEMHAFLYQTSSGRMIDLGTLKGGSFSEATGVNNSGQVVGQSNAPDSIDFRAFIYTNGTMWDLNALIDPEHPLPADTTLVFAEDINDAGVILASAFSPDPNSPNSIQTAYMLRPIRRAASSPQE
jgi:probable HAF family extracellular repeat protein